jgi:hypothetical protein
MVQPVVIERILPTEIQTDLLIKAESSFGLHGHVFDLRKRLVGEIAADNPVSQTA